MEETMVPYGKNPCSASSTLAISTMTELGIDIETYSEVSLEDCGMHKYVSHKSFEILLISYSIDLGPVQTIEDVNNPPQWFVNALCDPSILKTAFNANFEITCLNKYILYETPVEQWECTMAKASLCGYPMGLDNVAKAMGLSEQKSKAGTALIKFFSTVQYHKKSNTYYRNLPIHYPIKFNEYRLYNRQDVTVEIAIRINLKFFTISKKEREIWLLDHMLNNRGIKLDKVLVSAAIDINEATYDSLYEESVQITQLENPNSPKQLKQWLSDRMGVQVKSLTKESVLQLLTEAEDEDVMRLLNIRKEMAKTSTKKYVRMYNYMQEDDMLRGLLQYNGANKTGRWAGRGPQIHNLPRNKMHGLALARQIVRDNNLELLRLLYANIPDTMSQLIRTSFIPMNDDEELLVSDFSSIEALVTAWLAGEEWRMEVFRGDGKIYEASGAQMFNLPIEQIVDELRDKSKVGELALGYGGGVGAMKRMDVNKKIDDDQYQVIVDLWRSVNKMIVKLWKDVNRITIAAIKEPGKAFRLRNLLFIVKHNTLFIQLPSGRLLPYINPKIGENKWGLESIEHMGVDQIKKIWCKQSTYGGKLVENIVQGISRDILAEALLRVTAAGFVVVTHVHDEIVASVKKAESAEKLIEINKLMAIPPTWASDLPLRSKSFLTPFYLKN